MDDLEELVKEKKKKFKNLKNHEEKDEEARKEFWALYLGLMEGYEEEPMTDVVRENTEHGGKADLSFISALKFIDDIIAFHAVFADKSSTKESRSEIIQGYLIQHSVDHEKLRETFGFNHLVDEAKRREEDDS